MEEQDRRVLLDAELAALREKLTSLGASLDLLAARRRETGAEYEALSRDALYVLEQPSGLEPAESAGSLANQRSQTDASSQLLARRQSRPF